MRKQLSSLKKIIGLVVVLFIVACAVTEYTILVIIRQFYKSFIVIK